MNKWFLPGIISILALLSVVTLSSIASAYAGRQLVFFLVGGVVFWLSSKVSFSTWLNYRFLVYLACCIALIVPLFLSLTRGTARWIPVGDLFAIQPSQLAIPLVSFTLIWLLTKEKNNFSQVVKFIAWLLPPAVLILIEPDLGTTIIYLTVLVSLLFLTNTSWKLLISLLGIGLLVAILGWLFVLQPYQKARITSFLATQEEQTHSNYNAEQALIAVGSGQMSGRGLGQGVQSHLQFLPEKHTDFIFASLAEEYGYLGSLVVIGLLGLLIAYLLWMSHQLKNQAGQLFLFITALLFFLQATININMNIGLMPITGITLPFISYGGSSIISLCLMLGISQSIITKSKGAVGLHIS